jgi:stage V sporulation protein S
VAGAIAGVVRSSPTHHVEVQAIGAGAVNQAVKAIAVARDYLALAGVELVCMPAFVDVTIEGQIRTALRLAVEPRYEVEGPIPDIRGPYPPPEST